MHRLVFFLGCILIAFLSKCDLTNEENSLIEIRYDHELDRTIEKTYGINKHKERVLTSSVSYLGTVLDGAYDQYDLTSGKPISKRLYSQGKLNGVQKFYFGSGELKDSVFFSDGSLSGKCYSFYKNGVLSQISHWDNGVKFGERVFYTETGSISNYQFYMPEGQEDHLKHESKLDSLGYYSERGSLSPIVAFENVGGEFYLEDSIRLRILMPTPPQKEAKLNLRVTYKGATVFSFNAVVDFFEVYLPFKVEEVGIYSFSVQGFYKGGGWGIRKN